MIISMVVLVGVLMCFSLGMLNDSSYVDIWFEINVLFSMVFRMIELMVRFLIYLLVVISFLGGRSLVRMLYLVGEYVVVLKLIIL